MLFSCFLWAPRKGRRRVPWYPGYPGYPGWCTMVPRVPWVLYPGYTTARYTPRYTAVTRAVPLPARLRGELRNRTLVDP